MTDQRDSSADQEILLVPALHHTSDVAANHRVFQSIFEDLRQRIQMGEWLPGTRLPSISRLSKSMAVSTGSVREALRSLQTIGLVRIEHGRGVFVSEASQQHSTTNISEPINIALIIALAEARRLLEPELAALAAERGTPEELQEIQSYAKCMEHYAQQNLDFSEPDEQFHRHIALAARNPILYKLMENVHNVFIESRKVTSREPGMTDRAVRYHMLIAEAICDRNAPQARLLMLAHMNDALSGILSAETREHI
jgi:GntR family transcriptional repressor for pyruvate dehydrogenase complex